MCTVTYFNIKLPDPDLALPIHFRHRLQQHQLYETNLHLTCITIMQIIFIRFYKNFNLKETCIELKTEVGIYEHNFYNYYIVFK